MATSFESQPLNLQKMQEPRTSCAVAEKTKDNDSRAVPVVASVVTNDSFKNATEHD